MTTARVRCDIHHTWGHINIRPHTLSHCIRICTHPQIGIQLAGAEFRCWNVISTCAVSIERCMVCGGDVEVVCSFDRFA